MKKILTCLDGSLYSESVTELTAWAAQRSDASVHFLHILQTDSNKYPITDFSGNLEPDTGKALLNEWVSLDEKRNRLAREQGKLLLEEAARRLRRSGITNVTKEQLHGSLVEAVSQMEDDVNLLVLGKRGEHADFAKLHLGSNLERVIRSSNRPVLVASRKFAPIQKFLIAYDGGPSVELAIQFAVNNPFLKGMECSLLRAGSIDEKAEWYLQEAAEKLRTAGYEVNARTLQGEPEVQIAEVVKSENIDLLVMGAYGHSKIRQFVVGSTTTEMLRTCQVPVLMFR